mmetsp:Transcript_35294/g.48991  ORF Transcript_35294/g.48991 Transcript_35294/m.48991 type:complete len:242 (-) Transcript_35294:2708-3433(-)
MNCFDFEFAMQLSNFTSKIYQCAKNFDNILDINLKKLRKYSRLATVDKLHNTIGRCNARILNLFCPNFYKLIMFQIPESRVRQVVRVLGQVLSKGEALVVDEGSSQSTCQDVLQVGPRHPRPHVFQPHLSQQACWDVVLQRRRHYLLQGKVRKHVVVPVWGSVFHQLDPFLQTPHYCIVDSVDGHAHSHTLYGQGGVWVVPALPKEHLRLHSGQLLELGQHLGDQRLFQGHKLIRGHHHGR